LSGFASDLLMGIALPGPRRALTFLNAFALLGIALISASCAFLAYKSTFSSFVTGTTLAVVTLLLVVFQGSALTGVGMPVKQAFAKLHEWSPRPERLWLFVAMCVTFSQPVLLAGFLTFFPQTATQSASDASKLRAEAAQIERAVAVGNLQGRIAVETEFLARLDKNGRASVNSVAADSIAQPSLNRKALLIGNQAYPTSPLNNPRKDASDLERALKNMGFQATVVLDGNESDMAIAVNKYVEDLKPEDISFFYFSGHGFQAEGSNYLVPTDFTGRNRLQAVSLNGVVNAISSRHPVASIVVVDACRSYSYGGGGGLALTEAGANTFLAFAAKPGQYAQDGLPNSNGKFTAALLKVIQQPIEVDAMFRNVRVSVAEMTSNTQETWQAHNLKFPVVLPALQADKRGVKVSSVRFDPGKFSSYAGVSACISRSAGMSDSSAENFLRNCVNGRILRMMDDVKEMQGAGAALMLTQASPKVSPATAMAITYRTMWRDGLYALIASILVSILLALPFVRRENLHEFLRAYEQRKLGVNRDVISEARAAASTDISEMHGTGVDANIFLHELDFEPVFERLDPREDASVVNRTRDSFDKMYEGFKGKTAEVAA
jgi:hypothetical protein